MDSDWTDVTGSLVCPVCVSEFTSDGSRAPVVLACGCSICEICSLGLCGEYQCPRECFESTRWQPRANYALREQLSKLRASGQYGRMCANCDSGSAILRCGQCRCNLCGVCASQIHAPKALQAHQIIPISNHCAIHDQPTNFLCIDCEATICSECAANGEHRYHKTQSTATLATQRRAVLNQSLQLLHTRERSVRSTARALEEAVRERLGSGAQVASPRRLTASPPPAAYIVESHVLGEDSMGLLVTAKQTISEHFHRLQLALEQRKAALLSAVEGLASKQAQQLVARQAEVAHQLSKLLVTQSSIQAMLELDGVPMSPDYERTLDESAALTAADPLEVGELPRIPVTLPNAMLNEILEHGVIGSEVSDKRHEQQELVQHLRQRAESAEKQLRLALAREAALPIRQGSLYSRRGFTGLKGLQLPR